MTRRRLVSWVWNRILQREFKKSFINVRGEPNEIVNVHQILWGTKEVFHRFLGGVIEVTDLECVHCQCQLGFKVCGVMWETVGTEPS